jgi:hypothetical protein
MGRITRKASLIIYILTKRIVCDPEIPGGKSRLKRFLLQTGITLMLVGAILFAVSPAAISMAVVRTESETWYNGTVNLLPEAETSFIKWVKEGDKIVIVANVTEPTDPGTALVQIVATDSDSFDLINQTTGTLDTDFLVMTSQYITVTVSNGYDITNAKEVRLSISVEREVVAMQEVPNSTPTAGFAIFVLGAAFFLVGIFVKGGEGK